ncbi:MAG: VWA domain-containing protein [Thermoanaerobaculia bacterium]
MSRPVAALVILSSLALLAPASRGGAQTAPRAPAETPRFGERIDVRLVPLVVRVVDKRGRPVMELGPENFTVRVAGRKRPVRFVDWVDSGAALPATLRDLETPAKLWARPEELPGKLVVLFYQSDLQRARLKGQLLLRPQVREFLEMLDPNDLSAVVSFDSHLRLIQDFSSDPRLLAAATDRAYLRGGGPPVRSFTFPSLAEHLDSGAARRTASPEQALALLGDALAKLPGEKILVYIGWGLPRSGGVGWSADYGKAISSLARARVAVFVLDVTEADFHSLEFGLKQVAWDTGGTYFRTYPLSGMAVKKLASTISGYYVLYLPIEDLPPGSHPVSIRLRGANGSVLKRTTHIG